MAAGEYVSMRAQRELFERQIDLEREELAAAPEEEQAELALIYRTKGVPRAQAEQLASSLMRDPNTALDTLVREELGLDPSELGSPWGAAIYSFLSFAIGAVVPVLPYLFVAGALALPLSALLSALALFGVGAGVSLLTGRGLLFSGGRMLLIGTAAATLTYVVGSLLGVAIT
jgi:VIT1/CCC1 family predicted Fe2+/Mn2+ transporter